MRLPLSQKKLWWYSIIGIKWEGMTMNTTTKNYLKIALAGIFWGTLGLFGKTLESFFA